MAEQLEDDAAAEVAAMQFAGGMTIAQVADLWQRAAGWVEDAVRRALREQIPRKDGGLKEPRAETRAARSMEGAAVAEQRQLEW